MKRTHSTLINYIASTFVVLMLTACGGGGGGGGGAGGGGDAITGSGLSLSITDAPVNSADISEVVVRFTRVIVRPEEGEDIVHVVTNPDDPSLNYRDIELTQLTEGVRVLLGEFVLQPGNYQWVRLEVDLAGTHVKETAGGMHLMDCPSCAPGQSGLKLNRPFTIEEKGWVAWTIDFDLLKSLTMHPQYAKTGKNKYKLRPTLRIIETELASAFIEGTVTDSRTETFTPAPDACKVYVYEGDVATVVPDDMCYTGITPVECDPAHTEPVGSGHRPILEAAVVGTPNDAGGTDYAYKTGFLYPDSLPVPPGSTDPGPVLPADDTDPLHDGIYTVALLCVDPMDNPEADENFVYIGEAQVNAWLPGGYQQDFDIVDVFELSFEKTLSSSSTSVTPGDTLTYQFDATNTGNVDLDGVSIVDPLPNLSALSCDADNPVAVLAPAGVLSCTATYVVQESDVGVAQLSNTATADSDDTDPIDSTVKTTVDPTPAP